ncbi:hypothetical protein VE25_14125 [Devosia geojensis]|uniref:Uncharacterized protein n=1 Tax=Devosia geojensis TaxID=443610 RepID=A0A0F5FQQ9_9HYPH|nr:hypothetical protein [Devosia geojensis]KKB11153.1 hypothetical protein VE25_14125 [Devosia geojensis]
MNDNFNYNHAAELYPGRLVGGARGSNRYMRFPSAAEALQFAIEEMPREMLRGATLEVDEERFQGDAILDLYMASGYPLPRGKS